MALIGVVVCGAGPASDVGKLVQLLREQGHDVRIIATPSAVPFLDLDALTAMTGRPVRSEHRKRDEPRSTENIDGYIVAPATHNTINKLAAGISDTYALDVLNEAIGLGVRVIVAPFVNSALARRRPFAGSTQSLRHEGVVVLDEQEGCRHHAPGSGGRAQDVFPWRQIVDYFDSNHAP